MTWLIAHMSWLTCNLPVQKQQSLSGINKIFQTVEDSGRTAGYNVTLYGRFIAFSWERVGRGLHQQSHFN